MPEEGTLDRGPNRGEGELFTALTTLLRSSAAIATSTRSEVPVGNGTSGHQVCEVDEEFHVPQQGEEVEDEEEGVEIEEEGLETN